MLKTLMNSQSTSNRPVLCYVNKLTQHWLYPSLSIIVKSNAVFCAKHEMSANHETKGSCKMPCSPCLAIKCRLFGLPLIQNVVQHFLIVTSLQLCCSPSVWWHVPLGNDFDILILIIMTFLLEKLSRIVWKQPFSINHRLLPSSCESCVH